MRKKHRARANPSGFYLVASRKGTRLYYNGKSFAAKGRAKIFGTRERAKAKEREVLSRFEALETWAVYPERVNAPK